MVLSACRRHTLGLVAALLIVSPVCGQDEDSALLLEEFIHYTIIAKPDLAAAYAERLLRSPISDAELALILDEGRVKNDRFETAVGKAHRVAELEDIAAELDRRVSEGRLDLARDPKRIDDAIAKLTGNQRQKLHGRKLLVAAGEYAVPRLLRVITEGQDERLRSAAGDMLVEIGRYSVAPLCVALPHLGDRNQRYICQMLGEIGLPQAAPYLLELAQNDGAAAATRESAAAAFRTVGGSGGDLSVLYEQLGRKYFDELESLVAYPFESANNVWSFDGFHGLEATPVPTEIFGEIMAMRATSRALDIDRANRSALSLFIAANLKRENELPQGTDDPIYGENRYSPAFYATVFGPQICLHVLSIGLDDLDTQLVRDAIAALSQTTGGPSLFAAPGDRQPLLEALRYPDRRVQYEAALTLGRALPGQRFPGDIAVVPLLASAVRTGDQSFAVVIGRDEEDRRIDAERLENVGFTIIASGPEVGVVRPQIAAAVGVDLVVMRAADTEQTVRVVGDLHVFPNTSAAPVLILASSADMVPLKQEFRDNIRVKVSRARIAEEEFNNSVDEVMLRASGGRMTEAEAEAYAIEAIMTLRDISISGNTAYTIADAEAALVQALEARTGGLRLSVADILALIDSHRAQKVLFDAALAATDDERIDLLDRVAESVKRFGDRSSPRHVDGLLDLVATSSGRTAEAAARVHGALDLPAGPALDLIP
ncbi:MAG: HEAT repeat domain-containing protein [Planctomycetota bacterium]|jgi:HEAT repeat protein